jgi:hypothetical protein
METVPVPVEGGSKRIGTDPASYRIRVKGQLGPEWSEWFGGMSISCDGPNETTLTGQVLDQAALYGILNQIQALGLTLLSVLRETPPSSELLTPPT